MKEGVMEDRGSAKAPAHLWIVGVLAVLWNGFGAYDYLMTRTRGAAYIESMMPATDGEAFMAYIDSFPLWASFGWGLGVWMGLAGSVMLLMRHRLAVAAFALSLAGAVIGIGYQLMRPADIAGMQGGFNSVVPYLVLAIALALLLYARALRAKGLLR
jgi:hypothetical protein